VKYRKFFIILIAQFSLLSFSYAEVVHWQNNRVAKLEKITVGPWDNFAATITAKDKAIYFTRDSNQISNIYYQDLNTLKVERYVGEQGDAKQAVLNANGNMLATTYYKDDAQGDICLVNTLDKSIECITSKETVDQTPFWINQNTLGYIRRHAGKLSWELAEYDLTSKQTKVLLSGLISAPSASPDGRYILFNQLVKNVSKVHVYDRQTQSDKHLNEFDLPGITGFFTFSHDGKSIYFNHYLNDTNADQKIDGSDNSVVFRIDQEAWFSASSALFPEQLTSVDNNCKFPSLSKDYLYVTCAFEGSLDIYRLSLDGVVPVNWDEKKVWEAHKAARSYEQRLLLLNTIRYRFGKNSQFMLESVLSNHLEIGELTAARYYLDELVQRYKALNNDNMTQFYSSLSEILIVQSSKQRVPVDIVTTRFQNVVAKTREKLETLESRSNLHTLLIAKLEYELENYELALQNLQSIDLESNLLPLERYLIFELYKQLLLPEQAEMLLALFPKMFNEGGLSSESRLYYAFSYLKLLSQQNLSIEQRKSQANAQLNKVKFENIKELFEVELMSLNIAEENDKKAQGITFKKLRTALNKNKKNPLLRKAMHTRSIQNLGQANQFDYMELLSRNWLTVTHISEMEFVNVAEQYSAITMNKAYGKMADSELENAYSIFYSAIRQTNDLEAHFQFITLGLTPELNKLENMRKSYGILTKQKLIGQNQPYITALERIIKAERKEKVDIKDLDEALSLLSKMRPSGLNPAMRDLLMGYIYHIKMRSSQSGYAYDKSLFQRAHHHYMMALDLAQDNARVAATVWQNLGWLQFEVRQYGLAADFFRHRLMFPFLTNIDEVSTRWMLARTLFYNNQKSEALSQMEVAKKLVQENKLGDIAPYLEKSAFYAMQAEEYVKAIEYYELLFNSHQLSAENQAKSTLAYAYSLMENGNKQRAIAQFNKLVGLSDSIKVLSKNNQRLITVYPQRFQLLAYGFLAKLSKDKAEKIAYRQQRIALFKKMAGEAADYAYNEAGRLSFIVKDLHQNALNYEQLKNEKDMSDAIHEALLNAEKWMDETGDDVGPVIYHSLINYLSLNISHKNEFTAAQSKNRDRIIKRVFNAFEEHPYRSSLIVYQHNKLKVLWLALKIKQNTIEFKNEFDALLNESEIKQLGKDSPLEYEEIKNLVQYFQ